ncbi:MAG: iron ABC transporter permease [Candidatus Tectomicrobia bacterium]|uniref:Iron ABC transporter permease n=1 Tax=Tectimicrobiota bacterium TaxID=2528274 RepID=A0A932MPD2_UNCTE|nr:iron ABC transporter permease [Candidatus Tectomicrobia bacterium]
MAILSARGTALQLRRWRGLLRPETAITSLVSLFVTAMVVLPLASLVVNSFLVPDELGFDTEWGFGNYREMVRGHVIRRAFLNTLVISSGTTLLATFMGVALAWINARTNCPWRERLEALNLIPFFLSPFVGAIAWHNLASSQIGLLNFLASDLLGIQGAIFNVNNLFGIMWVTGIFFTPLVYLFVVGSLRRMDPSLEDSARTTGAGLLRTTLTVTLPLALPGILSGAIIVFVTSAGEFGVPFKLGTPYGWETLTTQIFTKAVGDQANYQMGAAMSMTLGAITAAFIWVQRRIIAPREFTTVTGKGFRPNLIDLGRWKWAAFGWNALYIFIAVILPILSLFVVSLHRIWTGKIIPSEFSFWNYQRVLFIWSPISFKPVTNGLLNSLILSLAGASLAMILGIVVSFQIHRLRGRFSALLDFLSAIPVGFPGIVIAVGVLITYIKTPIYATIWIILLGYVTRFFPYGQRNVASVMLAVSEELEQSSRMAGASWVTTMRRITLPLLKPGIFAGWILMFLIFIRELPMSLILYTAGTETLSVGIYYLQEYENEALTCTLSVIQTFILLGCVYLFRRAAGKEALSA